MCGKVKVTLVGYKRTKKGKRYDMIFKRKGQEVEFPYIEGEKNDEELYDAPSDTQAEEMRDIKLSEEQEKTIGTVAYLGTYSSVTMEEEEELRKEYEIGKEYEIIFPIKIHWPRRCQKDA